MRGYRDEDEPRSGRENLGVDVGEAVPLREAKSGKALLVKLKDHGDKQLWIPYSQIHDDSEVYSLQTSGVLVVTEWLANKEGLT